MCRISRFYFLFEIPFPQVLNMISSSNFLRGVLCDEVEDKFIASFGRGYRSEEVPFISRS